MLWHRLHSKRCLPLQHSTSPSVRPFPFPSKTLAPRVILCLLLSPCTAAGARSRLYSSM